MAKDRWTAQRAAYFIQTEMIDFKPAKPVLTIDEAVAHKAFFTDQPNNQHVPDITRKGSDEKWLKNPTKPMKGCEVVEGEMGNEAQEHFYMETQGALALPDAQGVMTIYSGTQQGSSVQSSVAQLLEIENSAVTVFQRPLGGGFGGKQTRPLVINPAPAIAAWILNRPVRLILDRNTDMNVTGKRHPYQGRFHATFTKKGEIKGYKVQLYSNGGSTYDLSFPVMDLSQQHSDGAYFVPTWHSRGDVTRTNNASNTAFRSFGVVQATLICEEAIEKIAHACGMRAEDVRWKNMYQDGSKRSSQTDAVRAGARSVQHPRSLEAADEVVRLQEAPRRRRQVQQEEPLAQTRADDDPAQVRRRLSTAPARSGRGVRGGVRGRRQRDAAARRRGVGPGHRHEDDADRRGNPRHRHEHHPRRADVDRHDAECNADRGVIRIGSLRRRGAQCLPRIARAAREVLQGEQGQGVEEDWKKLWPSIISGAYAARVNLAVEGFYKTPLIGDVEGTNQYGRAFLYFVYAAAASEVEIDVLTGETTVLRSDILIDIGHSLNPCLDVGQVEGAFVQGLGLMTTEQMMYEPDGRLYSNGTWEYKPPCSKSIPVDLRVTLDKGGDPNQTNSAVMSSRGIGEPPLVLSTSVFFAIKQAIMSAAARPGRRHVVHDARAGDGGPHPESLQSDARIDAFVMKRLL